MFAVAAIGLFIAMLLVLIRLYSGPTLYDRVLAVNSFGTHTVLFIGVLGFLNGRPDFLDIALIELYVIQRTLFSSFQIVVGIRILPTAQHERMPLNNFKTPLFFLDNMKKITRLIYF